MQKDSGTLNHKALLHVGNVQLFANRLVAFSSSSLSLFLIILEIWSYLSAHISVFPH